MLAPLRCDLGSTWRISHFVLPAALVSGMEKEKQVLSRAPVTRTGQAKWPDDTILNLSMGGRKPISGKTTRHWQGEERAFSHDTQILSWQTLESNSGRSGERRATLPLHHHATPGLCSGVVWEFLRVSVHVRGDHETCLPRPALTREDTQPGGWSEFQSPW